MIYVISKSTFGNYNVRDIQCNANWCSCPYSDYALIPDNMVEGILATKGYCDISLTSSGTEVLSYTPRTIPSVPTECCGVNTVLSVNGVRANAAGELTLTAEDIGAIGGEGSIGPSVYLLFDAATNAPGDTTTAATNIHDGETIREDDLVIGVYSHHLYQVVRRWDDGRVNLDYITTLGDPSASGTGINVSAVPGQLVMVKEVDSNGIPTAWEAIDRTHWEEIVDPGVDYNATITFKSSMASMGGIGTDNIIAGKTYTVTWKGTDYSCTAATVMGSVMLGNFGLMDMGDDTGEPFCMEMMTATSASVMKSTSTADTVAVSIYAPEVKEVHKLDPKYLPTGSSGGADWNAAEGEPGHVLNRTHWVEDGMVKIPVAGEWMETDPGMWAFNVTAPIGLEAGKIYFVNWNGTEYGCTAMRFSSGGVSGVMLGNKSILGGPDLGGPFAIQEFDTDSVAQMGTNGAVVAVAGSTKVPFAIYTKGEIVHKFPGKFLPDGVPYVEGSGLVEILPECQPVYIEDDGAFVVTEGVQELSVGETYIVNWNGTEYTCVGQDMSAMAPGAVLLGDGSNFGLPSTGEPFMIGGALEDGIYALMMMPLDGTTELTISIYHNAEVVHKLDGKFLPDSVPYVEQGNTAVILPETTLTADEEDPGLFGIEGNAPVLEIGKTYTVNWNGTEYIATAVDGGSLNAQMAGAALLANEGADLLTMTGVVFIVVSKPDGMMMLDVAEATELTISIMRKDTICHKLDNRCLDMDYIKESLNVAADTVKVNLADIGLEVVNLGRTIGTTGFVNLIRDVVVPITRGAKVLLDFKYNFNDYERTYHGYVTDWEVVELYGEALTMVHVLEGNDIYLIRLYISLDMGRVQTNVFKLAAELTTTEV